MRLVNRVGAALALKGNIRVLTAEAIISSMFYGMFFVIWQPFVLGLGASMTVLGGLSGTLGLVGSLSSPILGRLSDTVGRKPLLILSNILKAGALVFCILANTWVLLIPYVILMGLSASYRQLNPARASVVAESVLREQRGMAYSVLMFSSQAVTAVVAPLGGFLAMVYGVVPIFYACIAADIVCALLILVFVRETIEVQLRGDASPRTRRRVSALRDMFWPEGHLRGFYVAMIFDGFAWGVGYPIFYGMLDSTFGFSPYELGVLSAIMSVSWGLAQIPFGRLVDRYGRKRFLLISQGLAIASVGGWLLSQSFTHFALLQIPFGISVASWIPSFTAFLADNVPKERRAEAMGRLQACTGVLPFSAPLIGGMVYNAVGFRGPLFFTLLGAVATFILIAILVRETFPKF